MRNRTQIEPNTTLYPAPVVLITCGAAGFINVFSLNRIASCNAEPPMISISVASRGPVNIECLVTHRLRLSSHSLFVAGVIAIHADPRVLDDRGEVDFALTRGGLLYRAGAVREKPVLNFRPNDLLQQVHEWRDARKTE